MPRLTPAGTMDRPPLPVEQLDVGAWRILCWRQEHLPLNRIRTAGDWGALSHLEEQATRRVADRFGVDDDQRSSLLVHHHRQVERLAHQAHPTVVETREQRIARHRSGEIRWRRRRWHQHRFVPSFLVGWPTWFANRWVGLRDKRFWLLTRSSYQGQPD
jgi:hypothetical protein